MGTSLSTQHMPDQVFNPFRCGEHADTYFAPSIISEHGVFNTGYSIESCTLFTFHVTSEFIPLGPTIPIIVNSTGNHQTDVANTLDTATARYDEIYAYVNQCAINDGRPPRQVTRLGINVLRPVACG